MAGNDAPFLTNENSLSNVGTQSATTASARGFSSEPHGNFYKILPEREIDVECAKRTAA
jgi:hypothetical protein